MSKVTKSIYIKSIDSYISWEFPVKNSLFQEEMDVLASYIKETYADSDWWIA